MPTPCPLYGLADGSTYYYRVVSADPSGNVTTAPAVPAAPASFTTTAAPSCPCSIWPASATPTQITSNDPNAVELGLRWRSLTTGYVTGVRFYKGTLNTGVHTGSLWTNTGTLLATVTFTNETESGWQEALFSSPVPVEANTPYVISYHTDTGYYSFDAAYFQSAGVTNEPLEALANGVSGANGIYRYGGSGFPDSTFNAANYWVDVIFTTSTQTDTTAPIVVSTVPADGATEVDVGASIAVTFSETLQSATVNTTTVELRDASNASVPVVVTYGGANVVTMQPATPLASNSPVHGPRDRRAGGITDAAGNPLAGDLIWTFTTQPESVGDTTAADFLSGTPDAGIYVAQSVNGELTLQPSLATEFDGAALPTGWSETPWSASGTFGVAGGAVTVDGARSIRPRSRAAVRHSNSGPRSRPTPSSTSDSA